MFSLEELGYKGKKLEKLNKSDIQTAYELLCKEPRKYLYFNEVTDLSSSTVIREYSKSKTPVVFKGKVLSAELEKSKTNVTYTKIKVRNEETNYILYVNIFGSYHDFPFYEQMVGQIGYFGGVIKYDIINEREFISMGNPDLVTLSEQDLKIYPVYKKYSGISEEFYKKSVLMSYEDISADILPQVLCSRYHLMSFSEAIKNIHYPVSSEAINDARKRLMFNTLFYFASKVENSNAEGKASNIKPVKRTVMDNFISGIPYELTDDQHNAIENIYSKMKKQQTTALVQGDVSCGKTIVAICLMLLMAENGYQSVLVAPTVILARQHYEELRGYAEKLGYSVAFLCSDLSAKEKKEIAKKIEDKESLLIVGTHSCFSKGIEYPSLGLVITDEEHKFGVIQRESIKKKSKEHIHAITMSATPIPRTIACSIYGDSMEVITIKQMPKGRKPVKTAICTQDKTVFDFMEKQLKEGHQAYIVCPLIEEAEEDSKMKGISSIEEVAYKYKKYFEPKGYKIGVITGKTEKENQTEIKRAFQNNEIQILIATTVIEVGINVPNATVITITSAERFGLSTLHQLRGRVGRGDKQSYCILQKSSSEIDSTNLCILEKETDGFEIAMEDLKHRGTGNIHGLEQSGKNIFIENILTYPNLYAKVREIAKQMPEGIREDFINQYEEMYPSCL